MNHSKSNQALRNLSNHSDLAPRLDRIAARVEPPRPPRDSRTSSAPPPATSGEYMLELDKLSRMIEAARENERRHMLERAELKAKVRKLEKESMRPGPVKASKPVQSAPYCITPGEVPYNDRLTSEEYLRLRRVPTPKKVEAMSEIILRLMPTFQSHAIDARGVTTQEIRLVVNGGHKTMREAIDSLVEGGILQAIRGTGRTVFHRLTPKGREMSDSYKRVP